MTDFETLKEKIAAELDVSELLDIIDFDMVDLVNALSDTIVEYKEELVKALR